LLGFFLASQRYLGIPNYLSPFFVLSTIGVAQYLFAWCGILPFGTKILIGLGCLLLLAIIFNTKLLPISRSNQAISLQLMSNKLILYFLIAIGIYAFNQVEYYKSIDEYVFWGAISKWLFITNELPKMDTSIYPRHLDYVPGLAVFHYFIFQFFSTFNVTLAKFAQGLLALGSIFVYYSFDNKRLSGFHLSVSFLLATLLAGSIFFKLTCDYLLFLYFAAILWIYFLPINRRIQCIVLFPSLLYLILIKHIGIFLSVTCLSIMFMNQLLSNDHQKKSRIKEIIWTVSTVIAFYLVLKSWHWYCQVNGFSNFTHQTPFSKILTIFNWFDEHTRKGIKIFIKDLLFQGNRMSDQKMPLNTFCAYSGCNAAL
jgi:hypothetical protein